MKAFYQPLLMIALGVIVAFLLLGPDKKATEQLAHDKLDMILPTATTNKDKPSVEDEEVVFKCKKETAPAQDDADKMKLVPFKANE